MHTCVYLEARENLLPVQQQPGGPMVLVEEPAGARHAQGGHQVALKFVAFLQSDGPMKRGRVRDPIRSRLDIAIWGGVHPPLYAQLHQYTCISIHPRTLVSGGVRRYSFLSFETKDPSCIWFLFVQQIVRVNQP